MQDQCPWVALGQTCRGSSGEAGVGLGALSGGGGISGKEAGGPDSSVIVSTTEEGMAWPQYLRLISTFPRGALGGLVRAGASSGPSAIIASLGGCVGGSGSGQAPMCCCAPHPCLPWG